MFITFTISKWILIILSLYFTLVDQYCVFIAILDYFQRFTKTIVISVIVLSLFLRCTKKDV